MRRVLWIPLAILLLGGLYMDLQSNVKPSEAGTPQSAVHRLSISAPQCPLR
jgi:hypothetical protein